MAGQSFRRTIRASALLLCAVSLASSSPYAAANAWGVAGMSGMSGSYMAPCPSPVTVAAPPSPCPSPMPSPCPSPMPSPVKATPSPCPSPMPSPCPSPMPSPVKVVVPSPCPSPVPSPCPSPMPSPCPSPMPSPVAVAPSPCPSPMPSPVQTGPRCGSGYCPMDTQCCSYFSGKYTSCCPKGTQCCGDKCCAPSDKCYLEYYKWWKVVGSCEMPVPSPLPSPIKLAPSPCPSPMPSPCPSPMPSPVKLAPSPCPSPMPSPCPSPMPSPVKLAPSPCPSPMPSPVKLAPSPCPSPMPSPCPSPMPSPVKLAPSPCPSPMPSPCPSPVAAPKPHYNFAAKLTGMMCGKKAKAHGVVKGYYDMENELLAGYIELYDIKAVTQVHFHIGAAGVNGPVLAWIWPLDTKKITTQPFTTSDWSVMFTINTTDITFNTTSSPPVTNFAQLVSAIQKSNIYVNVHTIQHPDGEIRGQTYRYYN